MSWDFESNTLNTSSPAADILRERVADSGRRGATSIASERCCPPRARASRSNASASRSDQPFRPSKQHPGRSDRVGSARDVVARRVVAREPRASERRSQVEREPRDVARTGAPTRPRCASTAGSVRRCRRRRRRGAPSRRPQLPDRERGRETGEARAPQPHLVSRVVRTSGSHPLGRVPGWGSTVIVVPRASLL